MVQSIPDVIGGMKVAFITSLIGLFASFAAKVFYAYISNDLPSGESALLQSIKDAINGNQEDSLFVQLNKMQDELRSNMNAMADAIGGQSEASIATKITVLGNQTASGLSTVNQTLGDINKNLTESDKSLAKINARMGDATDELVAQTKHSLEKLGQIDGHMAGLSEAIRESLVNNLNELIGQIKTTIAEELVNQMRQTNKVIGEQLQAMTKRIEKALVDEFGETFKEFNEATHAIKNWQASHIDHVELLTEAFKTSSASIGQIRKDCESIPNSMKELGAIIEALNDRLNAFAEMKEKAVDAFPAIEERLDTIANDLKAAASGFDGLEETIRGLDDNIKEALEGLETRVNTFAETYVNTVNGVVEDITKQWGDKVVGIADHVAKELKKGDG